MIADYFVVRRMHLSVLSLYNTEGEYRFHHGYSYAGIGALLLGALPNLPGFLVTVRWLSKDHAPAFLVDLYGYSWFIGFGIAFTGYLVFRKLSPARVTNLAPAPAPTVIPSPL